MGVGRGAAPAHRARKTLEGPGKDLKPAVLSLPKVGTL